MTPPLGRASNESGLWFYRQGSVAKPGKRDSDLEAEVIVIAEALGSAFDDLEGGIDTLIQARTQPPLRSSSSCEISVDPLQR